MLIMLCGIVIWDRIWQYFEVISLLGFPDNAIYTVLTLLIVSGLIALAFYRGIAVFRVSDDRIEILDPRGRSVWTLPLDRVSEVSLHETIKRKIVLRVADDVPNPRHDKSGGWLMRLRRKQLGLNDRDLSIYLVGFRAGTVEQIADAIQGRLHAKSNS